VKILVVDTETGGLDPNVQSILSVGACVWNDGAIEDTLNIWVAEPEIVADPKALSVNGIDLEWLKLNGVGPGEAVATLENFLRKNNMLTTRPITVAGHNVQFDVGFMKRLYRLAGKDYTKTYSHRTICTQILAYALVIAERLPLSSVSGDKVFAHFRCSPVRSDGKHEAVGDAIAAGKALAGMIDMLKVKG
jgi:DNA polymerase III epsilon subunit-like protein